MQDRYSYHCPNCSPPGILVTMVVCYLNHVQSKSWGEGWTIMETEASIAVALRDTIRALLSFFVD